MYCTLNESSTILEGNAIVLSIPTAMVTAVAAPSPEGEPATTYKCFEFKLVVNRHDQRKIDHWLQLQNWIWNRGLALIEWREWQERWDVVLNSGVDLEGVEPVPMRWVMNPDKKAKKADKWVLACDRVKWRRYDPQNDIDGWTQVDEKLWHHAESGQWREPTESGWIVAFPGYEVVKDHWLTNCPLEQLRSNPYFDLVSLFPVSQWRHKLGDCPSAWVKGTCKTLADSWKAYRSGVRGRPRYKGKHNKIETLIHPNSKGAVAIEGGRIRVPNLGWVKVMGLDGRWDGQVFCPMKICRQPSGYYLQLTFEVPATIAPERDRVIAIDPGGKILAADDMGHQYLPCDVSRLKARIEHLQVKASRQYRANRVEVKDGARIKAHEDKRPGWKRRNLTKTYQAIGKLHERIRRKRIAHAHFLADRITSMADVIIWEDVTWGNLSKRNKAKVNNEGHFENNGAKSKAGLNKVMTDASPGLLRRLIEEKAQERGRLILLAPAINGCSGICNQCGHNHHQTVPDGMTKAQWKQQWRPDQATFVCQGCGHTENADVNAAKNLKNWGLGILRGGEDVEKYTRDHKSKRSTRKDAKDSA